MGMNQSLYTGWSGMATHQRALDTAGNNIANVNATGYKKNQFLFSSIFSQTLTLADGGTDERGGVNAKTMGVGVATGSVAPIFGQGPIEATGNTLDVAINGNGFFLARNAGTPVLTRNGSLYLDNTVNPNQRLLCSGDGLPIQGWVASEGVVSPNAAPGDILIPSIGDVMPGRVTSSAQLSGNLPTAVTGVDFAGVATGNIALKGNVGAGSATLQTFVYAPVTQIRQDASGQTVVAKDEVREIPVEISFAGPTLSPDGAVMNWTWEMSTRDWPNPGDPAMRIYPPPGQTQQNFPAGTIGFYANDDVSLSRAAGQAVSPTQITPGSSSLSQRAVQPDGSVLATSVAFPGALALDVSRLTSVSSAPGGAGLEAWSVSGSAKGAIGRTVTVFDERTDFRLVAGPDGAQVYEPFRTIEARDVTMQFSKTSAGNGVTVWDWTSSLGHATGTVTFNGSGEEIASASSPGRINYDFTNLMQANYSPSLVVYGQDGYPDGVLQDLSIDQYGKIMGSYSNHVSEALAQIAVATVPNPSGLSPGGQSLYYAGPASGGIMIGVAGDRDGPLAPGLAPIGAGYMVPESLEGSNVDLSVEFANLISVERGYQANARVITTSDEMLRELAQLKR